MANVGVVASAAKGREVNNPKKMAEAKEEK